LGPPGVVHQGVPSMEGPPIRGPKGGKLIGKPKGGPVRETTQVEAQEGPRMGVHQDGFQRVVPQEGSP
jgi:hypothetical protein